MYNSLKKMISKIIKLIEKLLPYELVRHYKKKQEKKIKKEELKYKYTINILKGHTIAPDIYNKHGNKMNIYFIKDNMFANPYGGFSENIYWDRYNFGLDTHFYTHGDILETVGNPSKRYAWLIESEAIVPGDYRIFEKYKGLHRDFDLIFTHSEKLLDKYDNARFVPGSQVWYGKQGGTSILCGDKVLFDSGGGGIMHDQLYKYKTKNISMVSSDKVMCELHKIRIDMANKLKTGNNVDLYGSFDGGPLVPISETLTDYRYSIAVENNINSFYFTEKLTNCFASMTVPIYVGATKIDKFFNTDGIIQLSIDNLDNIDKILAQCSENDYMSRLAAIKDNYNRVQNYLTFEDYMYTNYLKDLN